MAQPAAAAESPLERIAAAAAPYFQGKALTARVALEGLLGDPAMAADAAARQALLETLLDICIRSSATDCVTRYAGVYLQAAPSFPAANAVQKGEVARRALYYADYARYMSFDPALRQAAIKDFAKVGENALNPSLYLRRLALKAALRLEEGDYAGARGEADRMLSLIASLQNPQEASFDMAASLSDAIGILVAVGDTERAYGVYRSSAVFIHRSLGRLTPDHVSFRLTEAQVLEAMGMTKAAGQSLDAVIAALAEIEVDPDVRVGVLGQALSMKSVSCLLRSDLACAQAALAAHPLRSAYLAARPPETELEVGYLAARSLTAAAAGQADPVAAASLRMPAAVSANARRQAVVDVWRRAGAALAEPAGETRRAGLVEAGRAAVQAAAAPPSGFGAWYRPGFVDQAVIALALGAATSGRSEDEVAFALHQLAARQGGTFDADAMTVLAQASDEAARRTLHQALRLRARRDRYEREALQAMVQRAQQPSTGALLRYDFATRRALRRLRGAHR